jgi:hypothetical protein
MEVNAEELVKVLQELYPEHAKVVFLTIANRQLTAENRNLREALEEGARHVE